MTGLDSPAVVMARLAEIENDLAQRQNVYEQAAIEWYRLKRDREQREAELFLSAEGPVEQRRATARVQSSLIGKDEEALYEALRAVVRVLETRASIGQSLLKSQSRNGA